MSGCSVRLLSGIALTAVEFDCSGEAMVMDTDGNPYHGMSFHSSLLHSSTLTPGLTGGFSWDRRVEFIIPEKDRKAGVGHYYIEASCNGMFGQNGENPPDVSSERFHDELTPAEPLLPPEQRRPRRPQHGGVAASVGL